MDAEEQKHLQEFAELQDKVLLQTDMATRVAQQERVLAIQRQRSILTGKELSAMPDGTAMYKSIGRAYFFSPKADVLKGLEEKASGLEADIKKLAEQRQAIDKKMADTEAQIRELLQQSPVLARRLGAVNIGKAVRRQNRQLADACNQLRAAQEQLVAKEQSLAQAEVQRKLEQDSRINDLTQQISEAQRELEAARDMCRQASTRLEQSMSDLSVSETELRSARTQLQTAGCELALTRAQLEDTEGELGLTRSQNELMKREVDILRRQLREAGQQLEGYILVSRSRKNRAEGGRMGQADDEDDLAAAAADWDV
ncbi:hypothetical protein GPECTOR_20g578 [Gonium pectorale]|uniref:Prefoldin subunit 1 n=1 Tax=Gonium pectorale TaxID=33097 RepID=A0A150GIS5_GONPE|nr:hypothetical protein GPECTOR_20g578 [Gonium pectorale]|eukprot:KXZ49721.1 hypothetical protein GPECTOR_20g578 [Gonium pectorale]